MALDPITVEVIRAALNAAAERMRLTMIKTAYNHIISESLDFGCAIFDANVQMIAQGIGLPVFQGHLGFPIEATIQDRGLEALDRKSTRLNSSHMSISYAVFCLKKKKKQTNKTPTDASPHSELSDLHAII